MGKEGDTYVHLINLPPLPPGKTEIDVVADYLSRVREATNAQLKKLLAEVFDREERNIMYYFTIPSIYDQHAKDAFRAAIIQAGYLRDEHDDRLTLVEEPKALAMFCSKTGLLNLRKHDALLVVDGGGGTVDLLAYEVTEESPFTIREITASSGDSCGFAFPIISKTYSY